MNITPSKENILKKIRKALTITTPMPFPDSEKKQVVFPAMQQEISVEFAGHFTKLQGKFAYSANFQELAAQLKDLVVSRQWTKVYCCEENLKQMLKINGFTSFSDVALKDCDCSITTCEALVARTGTLVLSSAQLNGRTTSVYAPVHICIAFTHQLVYDINDAVQLLRERYEGNLPSLLTFATGPSRTADIEKTLVVGVHGPKEVFLFLTES